MANGVERENGLVLFSDDELREMSGVNKGSDHIEVTSGCTSHIYGDAVGRFRVFVNGDLEVTCECTPGCQEGLSLYRFDLSHFLFTVFFLGIQLRCMLFCLTKCLLLAECTVVICLPTLHMVESRWFLACLWSKELFFKLVY
ncbi:protein ULTRAPETALA 1-like [Pyrus ussuriensis x Pyrus communis]|uniref:Protein ULTRAPETALA 1-like n=1 Tax=Pyrus ussuriensis x Pyrus communis TaxID=2448454 RepID=A0A5N5FDN6_9ROSA|nr:protein ULTRAPETALA 1-like [Pyrus ussuriensis x Pyrus communis]